MAFILKKFTIVNNSAGKNKMHPVGLFNLFAWTIRIELVHKEGDRLMTTNNSDYCLSEMERSVLELLVQGKTNVQIGKALYISASTAKVYVRKIFKKIQVKGRVQATLKALKENIV